MKNRFTILFALLCASVMGWADTQYCETPIADGKILYTCAKVDATTYTVILAGTSSATITGCNNCNWGINDINGTPGGSALSFEHSSAGYGSLTATFTCSSTPNKPYVAYSAIATSAGQIEINECPKDMDWTATCGGGSTPGPDPEPEPLPTYCNMEIGHMANPSADANSFILLSVGSDGNGHTIVNIKQDAAKNTAMFDYINIVGKKETGSDVATGGSDEMAIMFNTPAPDGDGNITFTLQWSTVNWGGRWQINNITVPADATCASADPFPGTNAYCKYTDNNLRSGGANVTLTWATNSDGDVVITLGDGEGASNTHFRNEGFEYGGGKTMDDCWFVYSGTKHSVVEPASTYFNAEVAVNGGNTYALRLKDGQSVPANATIAFFGHAFSWKNDQNTNAYTENKWFAYDYGHSCPFLAAPTNVAVDGTKHITFDAVANAETYTAYVYLDGIVKHRQVVNSGDELTFQPYTTGTYQVEVVADAEGYPTSDPSDAYDWALTAPAIVVGNSEYCESAIGSGNQSAAITWETNDDGNIVITLKETLGGGEDDTQFRGANGMALANFQVGEARTGAGAYFNHTKSGKTITLSLKNSSVKPGLGEKIYYTDKVVEYVTSQNDNAYGNMTFVYTYGSKCSGQKHVSVAVNDNAMGSATVNGEAAVDVDENTQVTCVATPAEGYEFVNWTIGGVEVATTATYQPTITAATSLVANFDYARTTYCHTAVQTSGNKKVYLTVGKGATEGTYQIKIYGSDELTITGINNANTAINHVKYLTYDGNDVPLTIANGGWTFSNEGYGVITSAELRPQTGYTWRDMWMWRPDLFMGTSAGQQVINDILDNEHYFNWDNACADAEAPVFAKAQGAVIDATSVRLTIQASDNWEGMLQYTIARADAEPIISNHASGEEFTQDVTGLTTGTEYDFTVTVSDGVNNANTHILVTPVADGEAPVMGEASLDSKTWHSAIINVAATDNKGVVAYYIVELNDEFVPAEGKITVDGLTEATAYTFTIKAKDAAGNTSENSAEVSFTTDAHSLVPTTAAPIPTRPADQVKSLYSNTYAFAPASLNSYNEGWWAAPAMTEGNVDGNTYLHYNLAADGMIGWQFAQTSITTMEKLHIDIFSSGSGTLTVRPITDGDGALNDNRKTLTLVAQQWNSFDIDLTEFGAHNWAKLFQFSIERWNAGGLTGEYIAVDNVFFYRTTPPPADETAPTAVTVNSTVPSYTSATIKAQANDDSGVVHFKVLNGSDVLVADVEVVSGAEATIVVNGLAYNTAYNLSLIAYDEAGHEAEPVAVAFSTLSGPAAAPQPTHDAIAVLSVFSDAYEPAVAASFNRTNWGSAPVGMEADYILYTMSANVIVWGNNDGNAGHGNIDGLSGHTYADKPGLDISDMDYIHFDVWCDAADQLNTVNINDQAIAIPTTRTVAGEWVSFDVDITGVALADRQNLRWLKFHPFSTANCVAAIDNVYFWKEPVVTRDDSWMAPGELGTICIPQGAIAVGGDIYELMGKDEQGKIVFATVTDNHMAPGKPYLFEATSNEMRFYNTGETAATEPDNSGAMKGSFTDDVLYELDGVCYFNGRELWSCSNLTQLNIIANRAYVQLNDVQPIQNSTPAPGRRFITMGVFGQNAATGIDQLNGVDAPVKVMINGQLYILRGEKMYNANGQIVK